MKTTRLTLSLIVLLLTLSESGSSRRAAAGDDTKRIRFQVVAVEETGSSRQTISETVIEGPPGTDFNINLQASRFKMKARFLTDLISSDALRVRAKLDTRRLHGYSENHLPLYEEDLQSHALDLGFDEAIVLLPFGHGDGSSLKIEITPSVSDTPVRSRSGELRPLEINILKQSPGGSINVEAFKMPHNFEVEATLLEDGREVASAAANCLLEEAQELTLTANDRASPEVVDNPLAVRLTVSRYLRSRPSDEVAVDFDLHRIARNRGDGREAIGTNWAGIAALDTGLKYDLGKLYLNLSGKRYEIRFKVRLARGEATN
jgi:hypothetical protein